MEKKLKKSIVCSGKNSDGSHCRNKTLHPTGLCSRHRGFRTNSDNPKAHSGRNPLTVDSIDSLGAGPMSEEAFGYSDPRPWEGEKSFGDVDSYDRPKLEGEREENWNVPEVREAARRYGMVNAHLNEMTTKMNHIQDEITRRIKKQKGIASEVVKGREVVAGDTASELAGVHQFSERGEDTVKLTLEEVPGRFNAGNAESVIPENDVKKYKGTDVNTRKVPKKYRKMFDKQGRPKSSIEVEYTPTEGVGTDYSSTYDDNKLKHWGTGRLAEEYYRLRDVHQSYDALKKADAGYLSSSLPSGTHTATDNTGELKLTKRVNTPKTFDKKGFIEHVERLAVSDNPAEREEAAQLKKTLFSEAMNSDTVKAGDKEYGTKYYDAARQINRTVKWGELDYV